MFKDCIDEERRKPRRHNPCTKAAVVIAKSIYVEEEAQRREVEEDEFLGRFEEIEDDIRVWLQTDQGRMTQEKEIRRRKDVLREEIALREELITSQQIKIKKVQNTINGVTKRKKQFEAGEPYELHGYHEIGEAIKELTEATEAMEALQARVAVITDQVSALKTELKQDFSVYLKKTALDLIQKYCFLNYEKHVFKFRSYALKNNLKRHWDGEDGTSYAEWRKMHSYAGDVSEVEAMMAAEQNALAGKPPKRSLSASTMQSDNVSETSEGGTRRVKKKEDAESDLEYDYRQIDDMSVYDTLIYRRYREERDSNILGMF